MVQAVSKFGQIDAIIHTAGVGPGASNTKQVFEINLLGTANTIDAFLPVASPGTSLVCIASMAGSMLPSLSPELETPSHRTARSASAARANRFGR